MNKQGILKSLITMIMSAAFASILVFAGTRSSQESIDQPESAGGRELFLNNCARCHGEDAKGDKGPDLTSPKRQAKWTSSDAPLVKKITNGGFFMPKFGKRLSPEDIKEIASYVRSLGK